MRRTTILLAALAALMLVPAAQAMATPSTLKVNIEGSGAGEVNSGLLGFYGTAFPEFEGNPTIECTYSSPGPAEGECNNEFLVVGEAEGMGLRYKPAEGSEFAGITLSGAHDTTEGEGGGTCSSGAETAGEEGYEGFGAMEPGERICILSPDEPEEGKEVEATITFNAEASTQPLTLLINEGEGTVVSSPAGIECTGPKGEECTSEFAEGEEVTLTASPAAGYRFNTWGKCAGGTNGRQCTVTIGSEPKEVRARFEPVYDLTVSRAAGSEWGSVHAVPIGTICLYRCSSVTDHFAVGEEITLTPGNVYGKTHFQEFENGTGDAAVCNGETSCTFTVTETDSSVEALFVSDPKYTLSLEKAGGGEGAIRANPGAAICERLCTEASGELWSGTEVTVSWELAPGTDSIEFSGEAGDCPASSEETTGTCHIEMDEEHTVVATLE